MTLDPKKIREIARVCATLSKSAPTAEEHDLFANLALKWLTIARDREDDSQSWTVSTTTHKVPPLLQTAQVCEAPGPKSTRKTRVADIDLAG
jgi:hypothetical protein